MSVNIVFETCGGCGRSGHSRAFNSEEKAPEVCSECESRGIEDTGKGQGVNLLLPLIYIFFLLAFVFFRFSLFQ